MEKLHELHQEGQYDLLVLDTPPTRNALDFLDAPRRLARFIDSRSLSFFRTSSKFGFGLLGRGTGDGVLGDEARDRRGPAARTWPTSSTPSATWRTASASAPSA